MMSNKMLLNDKRLKYSGSVQMIMNERTLEDFHIRKLREQM